ncbi:M42 family metallopeptidase [Longimicrobium sp.]|uniref:M42 family metallopeptidase n=1 Tax=Longimicrobium sp. TaxID=2029185 RepID=UPI002B60B025|nr:M42 family metallopeptidase [Longimicrobium sp.]HSU16263.1 M42 family metallopeptidase [Longimicrobium sp.]
MQTSSYEFLKRLLDAPGPSGFETAAARVWRGEAEQFADSVDVDVAGNSAASLGGGAPRVMLAGHIDEIGVMVTHVDDDGFLYVDGIGGWDPQVLIGQRIRFLTRKGHVVGVVGKKPIHLMKPEEKEKAAKLQDLWVDVGAADRAAALERGIRVGDPGVVDCAFLELGGGLFASRAVDNRIGAFVVLEVLRALSQERPAAEVIAVATTQEEIGYHGGGARARAFALDPQIGIAVDLTFSSDAPGIEKKQVGEHKLGSGPVLSRGSAIHPLVFERLAETAEREGIPYTIQASPRFTSTDADAIYLQRSGVATAVVSIPNRYMHSPNEVVSTEDIDATIRLLAAFCRGLGEGDDFIPR